MRDYWLTQELLRAAGFGFLALAAMGVGLALWLPKKWWGKLAALLVVGLLISIPVRQASQEMQQQQVAVDEHKQRYAKAKALFDERCKTAGVKIHRTAESVEGVLLMKLRPEKDNLSDQFALDDPYGRDSLGDAYLRTFFLESYLVANRDLSPEKIEFVRGHYPGYLYVEAIDPNDGKRYRYTGRIEEPWTYDKSYSKGYTRFVLDKVPAPGRPPRYGVTYDDISTREEREYWIAGSSLRVIDLKTHEVMAERIGYMMAPGQGSTSGFGSPWLSAADHACPRFGSEKPKIAGLPGFSQQQSQTRKFVVKVLKPKLEN